MCGLNPDSYFTTQFGNLSKSITKPLHIILERAVEKEGNRQAELEAAYEESMRLLLNEPSVPAWFLGKRPVGGAVFSRRTAGNDAYQPPADPPRQALSSYPATASVSFFSPWLSRSKFRLHILVTKLYQPFAN